MKRHTLLVALVACFALGATACDDGLADLNDNPNAPATVPAQYLLPTALKGTVEQIYGVWFNLQYASLFAQHFGQIQYNAEDLYQIRPAVIDGWWDALYAGTDPTAGVGSISLGGLREWQSIIDKGAATGVGNHEAVGHVMKAFTGHVMTDTWGDIPWSQALEGDAEDAITAPAYDTQEEIYTALINELDMALDLFDPSAATFGAEDLIYQGDVSSWMRFANSLKLRLAMRISDVDAVRAQGLVAEVVASPAGLIDENAENAAMAFLASDPNQNPLFENRVGRDDHAVSLTLTTLMNALDDPRLPVYAEPAATDGEFRGVRNGIHTDDVGTLSSYSRIGNHWRDVTNTENATRPALLVTAPEVHFLLAEAALNGWPTPMTAQQHYEAGVTAALAMYDGADGATIGAGEIASYLAQPGVAWGSTPADGEGGNYELVGEQKWLALFTNGIEALAEYRRTGFPDEIAAGPDADYTFVPGRVPYPDLEQSLNAANLQAALQAQGIAGTDGYQGSHWWDPDPPS